MRGRSPGALRIGAAFFFAWIGAWGSSEAWAEPPLLDAWGDPGTQLGQLESPLRIDVPDPWTWVHSGFVLVVDGREGARRLQRFTSDGTFDRDYVGVLVDPVAATFVEGEWLELPTGRIAVLDAGADEVRVLDAVTGVVLDQWSVPSIVDGDVDFDPSDGTYWVCLTDRHAVQQYSFHGELLRTLGLLDVPGSGFQRFHAPRSVEAQGQVVVADTGNDRVVAFWYDYTQQLNWAPGGGPGSGPGQFDAPWAATMDCQNRVLVADRGNARVQRMIFSDADPDPAVFSPVLVLDEVWFDDGQTFGDLIDLVDPTGTLAVVGLPKGPSSRDVLPPGVAGLWALDRANARVTRYDDDCCQGGMVDPSRFRVTTAGGDLLVTPARTGPTLASVGATITLDLVDACGRPIVGFPREDVWLDDGGEGSLSLCAQGSIADAPSDENGRMTFSNALAAGGFAEAGLTIYFMGAPASPLLPIRVVSPDFNGDLLVNLSDIGLFAQAYRGSVSYRYDLNFDGALSLSDVGDFSSHLGASCP
jgi:hypothetical protein